MKISVEKPTIFCLHYLAGSAKEWTPVGELLTEARCVPLDLPGFGDAAGETGYGVSEMASSIASAIRARGVSRWLIAGHSMGAKVATVVARQIESGALPLPGLMGLVLLAGSPPGPEPMPEAQRHKMLGWFAGDANAKHADATTYIASNSGEALAKGSREAAIADVLRMDIGAWRAWLERGSREDWADRVGVLSTPTLILAGADDENLGPNAQKSLMSPHFKDFRIAVFAATKHLLPLERPSEVARAIDEHVLAIEGANENRHSVPANIGYRALLASNRVSEKTRAALFARAVADDPNYRPKVMDDGSLSALRAIVHRVVPQSDAERIDLAARIDTALFADAGDGWRFADLPPDREAYRGGLATIRAYAQTNMGSEFVALSTAQQDEVLARIVDGQLDGTPFTAQQMQRWFEDVRADAVKHYLGHPATLARLGYSGNANGGDGEPKSGFARIGIGEREAWEPVAVPDRT